MTLRWTLLPTLALLLCCSPPSDPPGEGPAPSSSASDGSPSGVTPRHGLRFSKRTFKAKVGSVRLQSKLIEQGLANEDDASAEVLYHAFEPPLEIKDFLTPPDDLGAAVAFVNAYFAANVEGTPEQLLAFWEPARQASLKKTFETPGLWERNRAAMNKRRAYTVHGAVLQGEVVSLLIGRGGPLVLGINLRAKGEGFQLTNEPPDDLQLAIVEAALSR